MTTHEFIRDCTPLGLRNVPLGADAWTGLPSALLGEGGRGAECALSAHSVSDGLGVDVDFGPLPAGAALRTLTVRAELWAGAPPEAQDVPRVPPGVVAALPMGILQDQIPIADSAPASPTDDWSRPGERTWTWTEAQLGDAAHDLAGRPLRLVLLAQNTGDTVVRVGVRRISGVRAIFSAPADARAACAAPRRDGPHEQAAAREQRVLHFQNGAGGLSRGWLSVAQL